MSVFCKTQELNSLPYSVFRTIILLSKGVIMKKLAILLLLIPFLFVSCEVEPEAEQQTYYTPTAEQITNTLFTEKGTKWEVSFFEYYKSKKKEYKNKQSKKGSGIIYTFSKDFQYSYTSWENDSPYSWNPRTITQYSDSADVSDGHIIFHNLFGETRLNKTIELSENGNWIKIGGSAYRHAY